MSLKRVVEELKKGPVTFRAYGNSMTPLINNGDTVTVAPVWETTPLRKNDIVLAYVAGRLYLHKIVSFEGDRVRIGNNHGKINGTTARSKVYGKVVHRK